MALVSSPLVEAENQHRPASVSVIVSAHSDEDGDDIVSGVEALEAQTRWPRQIVIVIDHNDDLLRWAADHFAARDSNVRVDVIANTLARGVSGSRNTGLSWCDGDVIAFLGDNARTNDRYWLATMLEDYADPDVAGVSGGVTPDWGDVEAPGWFPKEFGWVIGCSYAGLPTEVEDVANFNGRNVSFRREVFDEIGGFCDGIGRAAEKPAGYDETEYCIRLRRRFPEARLLFDPDLDLLQRVSQDRQDFRYFRLRCFNEGLSKAIVARRVGPGADIASEGAYSTKRLSLGVLKGVADGIRGNVSGFRSAGAIVLGFVWATAGYARGRMGRPTAVRWGRNPRFGDVRPG